MKSFSVVRQDDGAAAVEFIIIGPMLIFFTFVCLQFAVILFAYLSLLNTARDMTRWVTFSPNTIDSAAISAIQARIPSDMNPSKLSISISPACTVLVQNKCPNRATGQDIAVTVTYDISGLYFLPTTFNFMRNLSVQFPTTLPPYTMHMQAEPS